MVAPMAVAAGVSYGLSAFNTLFGDDPNEKNREIQARNREFIAQRMDQIQAIMANRGEIFGEHMDRLNPMLAFGDTQGRQAASAGARAAQARVTRSLGTGGGVLGAALEAGAQTSATDRQNTLRALAIGEANKATEAQIRTEASFVANQPFAMDQPFIGGQSQANASLFAQLGTAFAGINQQNNANQEPDTGSAPDPGHPSEGYL